MSRNRTRLWGLGAMAGGLCLALALGWTGRPDRGPPARHRNRNVAAELAAQRPLPAEIPGPMRDVGALQRASASRPVDEEPVLARPVLDPNEVYINDLRGVARAAMARKEPMLDCLRQQEAAGTLLPQRVAVEFTLREEGDAGVMSARMQPGESDTPIADACLEALFRTAHFEPPDEPTQSFVWPFPASWLDEPPADAP